MTTRLRRIGVLGGTFDPIHLGHLAAARAAVRCAQLDQLLLIPAGRPPHRPDASASAEDRLAMTRLAAAGSDRVAVSDLEVRRGGRSYTVDTLRELRALYPDAELFLVLGWDAAREIRAWQDPDHVLSLAKLVIITRPGLPAPSPADLKAAGIDPERAVLCPESTPDVEATAIRQALAAGEPLNGMLAPEVSAYIAERGLYRHSPRA